MELFEQLEAFGPRESNFTHEEKKKISEYLKVSSQSPVDVRRHAFTADRDALYYYNMGNILGGLTFAAGYYWPVIRKQPVLRRIGFAALPAYFIYNWCHTTGEDVWWERTYTAYQKWMWTQGKHAHVFI